MILESFDKRLETAEPNCPKAPVINILMIVILKKS
jgi:hypothetical protein